MENGGSSPGQVSAQGDVTGDERSQSGLVTEALGARLKLSRQSRAIQGVGTEQRQSEWTVVPQQGPLPEEVASSHSQENSRSPDQSPPKQPLGVIFNLLFNHLVFYRC